MSDIIKGIKVVPENENSINDALQDVQKGCRTRTMDYKHVSTCVAKIDRMFSGIPQKAMIGMKVSVDYWAENFPRAYLRKGRPESTVILLVRRPSGWFLMGAKRDYTRTSSRSAFYVSCMPEEVQETIIKNHRYFEV